MLKATKHGSTNYSHFSKPPCEARVPGRHDPRVAGLGMVPRFQGSVLSQRRGKRELLTRRRLGWEEGELLLGTCCTPCDPGLVDAHLCTRQLRSQQGREILALWREKGKKRGISGQCPPSGSKQWGCDGVKACSWMRESPKSF